jgi:hypothetical protein
MLLREAYEKKEIFKIRWIDGKDNLVDAYMKKTLNGALERLISINTLRIKIKAYVDCLD